MHLRSKTSQFLRPKEVPLKISVQVVTLILREELEWFIMYLTDFEMGFNRKDGQDDDITKKRRIESRVSFIRKPELSVGILWVSPYKFMR